MRKFDKIINLKKANILAEQRYISLKEGFEGISSIPEFNNKFGLVDNLVSKALDVDRKHIDWDVKREMKGFNFSGRYRVETPELNYTLLITTSYVFNSDPDIGGFQGETIWIRDFDNINGSWVKYEHFLNEIEEDEINIETLSRETQDKLERTIEEFKTHWWDDEFNY